MNRRPRVGRNPWVSQALLEGHEYSGELEDVDNEPTTTCPFCGAEAHFLPLFPTIDVFKCPRCGSESENCKWTHFDDLPPRIITLAWDIKFTKIIMAEKEYYRKN